MFDVGDGLTWVTHLGMSGRMSVAAPGTAEARHTHVVIRTGAGCEVRMVDPRTFGFTAVFTAGELAASTLASLGPDALTALPPAESLAGRATGRRVAIKTLLIDQRFLAGLGNIYASEVLFRARIAGGRPAGSLRLAEFRALRERNRHGSGVGSRARRDLPRRPRLPPARRAGRPASRAPGGVRQGWRTVPQVPHPHPPGADRRTVLVPVSRLPDLTRGRVPSESAGRRRPGWRAVATATLPGPLSCSVTGITRV